MESAARKLGHRVPAVPDDRAIWFSFLFMAAPGPSYAMKNYLLALSGVPFAVYFLIGWLVQSIWGVPFVVLGEAAYDGGTMAFFVLFILLLAAYFFQRWIRKKYRAASSRTSPQSTVEPPAASANRKGEHS